MSRSLGFLIGKGHKIQARRLERIQREAELRRQALARQRRKPS